VGVRLHYFTDPVSAASWAAEPSLRRLLWEFGDQVSITYVMGGLARDLEGADRTVEWLDVADRSGMPVDPRLWSEAPIRSSYPACIAVKAAGEQGAVAQERFLRATMEGLFCFRRKLDVPEALVDVARDAGLDVARFRVDVASNAAVEAFGADLDRVRSVPAEARAADAVVAAPGGERLPLPTLRAEHDDGSVRWAFDVDYAQWRAAVPLTPRPAAPVDAALARFGRMATVEVAAVCGLPGPRAAAELWRLAEEWRVKPVRVLTGWLWEAA
jgi:putative protein-disulfide isomerase